MGGKFHLKLNNGERPIANKYREGKMQRTLKRELKVLEIVKREAIGASTCTWSNQYRLGGGRASGPERFRPSESGARCLLAGALRPGSVSIRGGRGDQRRRGNRACPSRARPALTPPRVRLPSTEENRGSALGWSSVAWGVRVGGTARCASRLGPSTAVRLTRCLGMLTKWLQPTRLETRTKESNICASDWVTNP